MLRNAAESKNCNVIDLYNYHLPYDSIDGSHPNRDGMHTLATLMLCEMFPDSEYTILEHKDRCQNSNGITAGLNNHQNLSKHKGLFGKLFGGNSLHCRIRCDQTDPLHDYFTCHHLRHTFATRLCESGINIKVIQNVLGHVDISTTMNIYIDVTKDLKKEEMQNFANYVRSGNSKEPIINSI